MSQLEKKNLFRSIFDKFTTGEGLQTVYYIELITALFMKFSCNFNDLCEFVTLPKITCTHDITHMQSSEFLFFFETGSWY